MLWRKKHLWEEIFFFWSRWINFFQFHRVSLDVLKALKNNCRFYCTVCMTFRACEAVFLTMLKHKEYSSTWTKQNPLVLKKNNKWMKKWCIYRTFSFPLPEGQAWSGPRRSAGQGGMWLSLKHMPIQICSTNINLLRRDFKPHGALAALLDTCDLSDILALAPGDSVECVLKGVAPADSELTCSTEQRCTEYLWHWNSWEFFLSSPVLGRISPRCVRAALRHV